jgi:hypothetical protein
MDFLNQPKSLDFYTLQGLFQEKKFSPLRRAIFQFFRHKTDFRKNALNFKRHFQK